MYSISEAISYKRRSSRAWKHLRDEDYWIVNRITFARCRHYVIYLQFWKHSPNNSRNKLASRNYWWWSTPRPDPKKCRGEMGRAWDQFSEVREAGSNDAHYWGIVFSSSDCGEPMLLGIGFWITPDLWQGRLAGNDSYSTVTLFARFRGLSTSQPRSTAMW